MVETNLSGGGYPQKHMSSASLNTGVGRHDSGGATMPEEELTAVSIGFMVAMALLMLVPAFLLFLGGVLWIL